MFQKLLSALGLAPKNLNEAREIIAPAKAALDSVAALFASAGLDLDAMLAAGPDSLKAHLDGLSAKDAELATAQASVTELTAKVTAAEGELAAHKNILAAVGFKSDAKAEDIPAAFEKHVSLRAAELLAKTGTPPLDNVIDAKPDAVSEPTDADLLATYEKMTRGSADAVAFAQKNFSALLRADRNRAK